MNPEGLRQFVTHLEPYEQSLLALILVSALLFVMAFVLASYAVYFRFQNAEKQRRRDGLRKQWDAVLSRIIAGDAPVADIYPLVKKRDVLFFIDYLMRYARRVKGEELKTVRTVAKPYLPELHARCRRLDPERRARAMTNFGILGFEEQEHCIVSALDDPSPIVVLAAVQAICSSGRVQHVPAVLKKMARIEQWSLHLLTNLLASFGTGAVPAIRNALADPSLSNRTRMIAAETLARLSDADSADLVEKVLRETSDRELKSSCLRVLEQVGRPDHIGEIRFNARSRDDMLKLRAIGTMGKLGTREDIPFLKEQVDDANPWIALQAAKSLLQLGQTAFLRELAASSHPRSELAQEILSGTPE